MQDVHERSRVAASRCGGKRRRSADECTRIEPQDNTKCDRVDSLEGMRDEASEVQSGCDAEGEQNCGRTAQTASVGTGAGGTPSCREGSPEKQVCGKRGREASVLDNGVNIDSADITMDQHECLRTFDAVMEKLVEASKEIQAAEDSSKAALSSLDRRSIEADRVARMELKHATQHLQDLREEIGSLASQRYASSIGINASHTGVVLQLFHINTVAV